jgi:hypothetical protein
MLMDSIFVGTSIYNQITVFEIIFNSDGCESAEKGCLKKERSIE